MYFKFHFRRSLLYLALYKLVYYIRFSETLLMDNLTSFKNPTILTFLMSLGEIIGGLSVFLFVRRAFKKRKMNYLKEKLLKDKKNRERKDRWSKRILLIFIASFFDFVEFIILNDFLFKFDNISPSINVRFSAFATISSTILCVYGLNFKTGRHQKFSIINIGILIALQFFVELAHSSNYIEFSQVFFLNLLHLIFMTFTGVIERYLADINFPNPFCILFGEGIFSFIFTSLYVFFSNRKNPFVDLYNLCQELTTGKFILLLFLFFIYMILSAVYNVYKIYCNVYLSPMAKTLIDYLYNPIYLIYSFLVNNDFLINRKSSYSFFFLNEILSIIFTLLGFVYNGYIVLYCHNLEIDTTYDISIRARESLKDDKLEDIKEDIPIYDNIDEDED